MNASAQVPVNDISSSSDLSSDQVDGVTSTQAPSGMRYDASKGFESMFHDDPDMGRILDSCRCDQVLIHQVGTLTTSAK